MDYKIVPFNFEVCEQAATLHASAFDCAWSKNEFEVLLTVNPGVFGFKAVSSEEQLCGFILLQYIIDDAEILTLGVSKNCRQQGIGKELIKTTIKKLFIKGAKRLLLEVSEYNKEALLLYKSLNFKAYGRRKNYYLLNDKKQADALLLEIKLNN
ncbi:MAG: GNAT family N-acetyltransferase [Candidatus Paracaedimonas acanthamoebae]|uniref:N-alpha-acetyltransferase 60 n=1 Tax=Candidatus Paracaedimonas acanthamoebae TaxID=244581 RepID=A0A8J7Q050_9PROT|nr:GNAT family N-acetyltransferase [Candidatus Paracaedimonas acanthamoebae]